MSESTGEGRAGSSLYPLVPGFRVIAPLGSGAMSSVWRAIDDATGRVVALKVLHPHVALSRDAVERFLHEVRAYERLRHPNIISCLSGGEAGEHWHVALEYLGGGDLRAVLRGGRLPPETAAWVIDQVLKGLRHAHAAGVVHRDVKPENVMIDEDGELKLADFGISTALDFTRLTEPGTLLGTPAYMAPERIVTGASDPRSDLWSVGVLLHEMVTGTNPFAADRPEETVARLRSRLPAPMGYRVVAVPDGLEEVVARLLVAAPSERMADAGEVSALLAPVIAAGGRGATREGFLALLREPAGARREWAANLAAARVGAARQIVASGRGPVAGACQLALEGLELDPSSPDAEALAAELAPRAGARVRAPVSARALELERQAEENPTHVQPLTSLVRVGRGDGNLLLAARAYRWGRRRSPSDRFAFAQLAAALGFEHAAFLEGVKTEQLQARLQGGSLRSAPEPGAGRGRALLSSRPVWMAILLLALVITWDRRIPPAPPIVKHPVVARPPDVGLVYLEKAAAIADGGDAERALAIYGRFLGDHPEDPRRADALFRSARLLAEIGRRDEAIARYRELLARFPSSALVPAVRQRLARALEEAGSYDEALAVLAPLAGQGDADDRVNVALLVAGIRARAGDIDGALAAYDRVLSASPSVALLARARLGRGRALALRRAPEARWWLERAMAEAGPGSLVAREAAELLATLDASP